MARTQICPKCRAILEPGTKRCPYCETDQRHVLAPTEGEDAAATARLGLWLIGLNVALYALMVLLDPARGDAEGLHLEPSDPALVSFGLSEYYLVETCGQYWRLLTATFVHLSLLHLAFNVVALYILTPLAATTFGMHRTLAIYLVTGVGAALASHLATNSGGGASGALCGLIGALAVYGYRRKGFEGRLLQRRMMIWAVVILVFGRFSAGIDNVAHVSGFVLGAGLGWLGAAVRARGGRADRIWALAAWSCAAAALAAVAIGFLPFLLRSLNRREVELFRGDAARALRAVATALEDGTASLPGDLPEGPAGTAEVRAAVNRALAAARAAPRAAETRLAYRDSGRRLREWVLSLRCSHGIGVPTRGPS